MGADSPSHILIEELDPAEFQSLSEVYEGFVPPSGSVAIVARHRGEIAGRVFIMSPAHVEGPWVRDDLRGSLIGKRLMDAVERKAKERGATKLFAYAASDQLANYLLRLGYKHVPYTVWEKEL